MAYHAEAAGQPDLVRRYAPVAARCAAELGAHREAVAQYERALRFAPDDVRELAELYDGYADTLALVDRWPAAAEARQQRDRDLARARRGAPRGSRPPQALVGDVASVPWPRVGRGRGACARAARATRRRPRARPGPVLARVRPAGRRSPRRPEATLLRAEQMAERLGRPRPAQRHRQQPCVPAVHRPSGLDAPHATGTAARPGVGRRGAGRAGLRQRLHVLRRAVPLRRGRALLARRHRLLRRARHHDVLHLPARPPRHRAARPRALGRGGRPGRAGPRHRGEPGQPAHLPGDPEPGPRPPRRAGSARDHRSGRGRGGQPGRGRVDRDDATGSRRGALAGRPRRRRDRRPGGGPVGHHRDGVPPGRPAQRLGAAPARPRPARVTGTRPVGHLAGG